MIPGPYQLSGYNIQLTNYNKSLSKKCSTLKSQQSQGFNLQQSVILGNQSSIKESKYTKKPDQDKPFDEKTQEKPALQKLGTSQFGAAQFGMLHSWANISNNNPFIVQQAESMISVSDGQISQNKQDLSNHSGEEKRDRENSESFHIANPMENGSQLTVR